MSESVTATSYDDVPYEGHIIEATHPDRLATVATLLGLRPPPLEHCRVLELGCANGANLIPMALSLPGGSFVGIDLSRRQVEDGERIIAALGASNVALRHASITDIGPEDGTFDYILCHGVFSWVPEPVQEHILKLCAANLADDGIAYISYNTYPGWHLREIIRDMLRFRGLQFTDARQGLSEGLAFVDFAAQVVARADNHYAATLKAELELLLKKRPAYLLHEHLEDVNAPTYFEQFAARAARHGLHYLGESEVWEMLPSNLSPEVDRILKSLFSTRIQVEQALDFLRGRTFRQTLLTRRAGPPDANVAPERALKLFVAAPAKPADPGHDPSTSAEQEFVGLDDVKVKLTDPLLKTALVRLAAAWPRALAFEEVLAAARARLGPAWTSSVEQDRRALAASLTHLHCSGSNKLLEFRTHAPAVCAAPGERPRASPWARWQASTGGAVTSLLFKTHQLDEFGRNLLALLDGTRDRADLEEILRQRFAAGAITLRKDGQAITEPTIIRQYVAAAVGEHLRHLARNGLLIG